MTPRRESKKMDKSARRNRKDLTESSEDSDDSTSGSPPPLTSESENDSDDENAKVGKWWHQLNEEEKKKRKTCIKIHLLSPLLFGVVPPGHKDKLIDWSYECGLLPIKDVLPVVPATNKAFWAIHIVENAFEVLTDFKGEKVKLPHIIGLKNDIVEINNCKSALERAEAKEWFSARRTSIRLPPDGKKDMASMALLLAVYHFARHIQLSYNKTTDVLKRFNEDCKHAEEKALELKEQGNVEFANDNYRAAISIYTRAVVLSPFNYIMYGNRAQSYQNVGEYRQAMVDAKRAVILKPDWDKGQYRFKQAAIALYGSEGDNASFLMFCVDKDVLTTKNETKQNGAQAVKKESPETTKGVNQK